MRNLITSLTAILLFSVAVRAADPMERVKQGFGATLSATVTPQELLIRQKPASTDFISNGTFAADSSWTKGTDWTISGGAAVFATTNYILNGTFDDTTSWTTNTYWIISGGKATFNGNTPELVVNGTFTNVGIWVTNTLWIIDSGKATFNGTAASTDTLYEAVSSISGTPYRVNYTISGIDGAAIVTPFIGAVEGTARTTNGVYSENITALKTSTNIIFQCIASNAAATAAVDNVSMLFAGSITDTLYQAYSSVSGTTYKVNYTISGIVGNTYMTPYIGAVAGEQRSTNGVYSENITALKTTTNLIFQCIASNSASTGSVDSVICRPNGMGETNDIYQTYTGLVQAGCYRIYYTVAGLTTNVEFVMPMAGSSTGQVVSADGSYSSDIYLYGASQIVFRAVATNISTFTIDDVSAYRLGDLAYVNYAQIVLTAGYPIYFILNGSGTDISNSYTLGQCLIATSNNTVTIDSQTGERKIDRIWYRTSSGTGTAYFNGN